MTGSILLAAVASYGAALAARLTLVADAALSTAARAPLGRLASGGDGPALAAAMAALVDAIRISDAPGAAQILVDLSCRLRPEDLARAPDRPPLAVLALVLPAASRPLPPPRSLTRRRVRAVEVRVASAFALLAAGALARRAMVAPYATRADAAAARTLMLALADPILDDAAVPGPAFTTFSRLIGFASGHLIDRGTTLKPVIRVETRKPQPASLLAWQIYGDTTQADELVARNAVATPCFMPLVIEAVGP